MTGRRAFAGEDVSDLLVAVLSKDVDFTALPSSVPPRVRELIARCLDRDLKTRLRDIGEARVLLSNPQTMSASAASETAAPSPRPALRVLPWMTTALFASAAAVAVWGWMHPPAAPPRTVTRAAMILPPSVDAANDVAVSRDGTRLAYWEATGGGQRHIVLRMLDQLEGRPIPGTEDGDFPAFSPDGEWIAFATFKDGRRHELKKVRVTGGTPVTLCDLDPVDLSNPNSTDAWISWDDANTVMVGSKSGLIRVPATGGKPEALTTIDAASGERVHGVAQVLPGGRAVLFTVAGSSPATSGVAVADLKTRRHRVIVSGAQAGRYVPTGHLVYKRGDVLFAAPFDEARQAVTGAETPVVEGITRFDYAFSQTGILLFTPTESAGSEYTQSTLLKWIDRKGVARTLDPAPRGFDGDWAVSPDGRLVMGSIVLSTRDADASGSDIWKYDTVRATLTKMTHGGINHWPTWTRDGQSVAYSSLRDGTSAIYRMSMDANGPPALLVSAEAGFLVLPSSWAPDGSLLYLKYAHTGVGAAARSISGVTGSNATTEMWILPPSGNGTHRAPQRLLEIETLSKSRPQLSPDGKALAYESSESGQPEIYVVPYPGPGGKVQISSHGGTDPKWSRNGNELFYLEATTPGAPPRQLMSVNMATVPPGRPQLIVTLPTSAFDVTPDPQRFLSVGLSDNGAANTFIVITNWFEDLLRRAPVKK